MLRGIVLIGISGLLLVLSGCTPSAPVVSKVVLSSGVDNNSFKVGETPTLSAVAQDAGGNPIAGKTFTWASSNDNIASVDASGRITAKQVGSVKIGAATGSVRGDITLTIYGLQVVGGVAKYIDNPAANFFIVAYRLMLPGGGEVPAGTLSITGPTGFNAGNPRQYAYTPEVKYGFFSQVEDVKLIAIKGNYKASTTVSGQTFEASFSVDNTQVMGYPADINVSNVSTNAVSGSWSIPVDAKYFVAGVQLADTDPFLKPVGTTGSNATITGLSLVAGTTYRFVVQAFSFQNFDQALPAQFNSALNVVRFKP